MAIFEDRSGSTLKFLIKRCRLVFPSSSSLFKLKSFTFLSILSNFYAVLNSWFAIATWRGVPYFIDDCFKQVFGCSRSTLTVPFRLFFKARINGVEKSRSTEFRNWYWVWRIFNAFCDEMSGLSWEFRFLELLRQLWWYKSICFKTSLRRYWWP